MKIKKFLGFMALAVLVILPIKANAASYGIGWSNSCTPDPNDKDYCTVTITGTISDGGSISTALAATMTLQNMEYISAEGSGNWLVTVSGAEITMTPSSPEANSQFTIGTLRFKKINSAEKCKVEITCEGKKTTVTPPVTNPKTGNALPYAVIGAGIVIAGAVYYVTRKNTKLCKI